ncbi:hypothetical protein ACFE04_021615 [Oxalis oulophora]
MDKSWIEASRISRTYKDGVQYFIDFAHHYAVNLYMFIIQRKAESLVLDHQSLAQAHRYVLLNHKKIIPYREHFLREQISLRNGRMDSKTEEKLLVETFPSWLQSQVPLLEHHKCDEEIIAIAIGPSSTIKRYKGFNINGFKFLTKQRKHFIFKLSYLQGCDPDYFGTLMHESSSNGLL